MLQNLYKSLIFSTLFLFITSISFSQKAILKGVVMDGEFNEPMISATISFGQTGTVSDMDGNYSIELEPGTHQVIFSYVGYETIKKSFTLAAGEIKEFNLTLNPQTNILQTATVTSGKFEKPLGEVTVSLEVLKPSLIESANATSIDDVLGKLPGLTMVGGQVNIRGGAGWSYGAGSRVLMLVDDIPALQADAGLPQWDDIAIENIAQVEVVKGAASALYGSSALNGIINVRTAYAKSEPFTKVTSFYKAFLSPKDDAKKWWAAEGETAPYEYGFSMAHRQKINKMDLVLSGFFLDRKSINQNTGARYGRLSVGTRYRINDNLSIGFNSVFNPGRSSSFFLWKNGEEGAYQAPDEANFGSQTERLRYFIDPFVTYFDKSGNKHKLMGRFYRINNKNDQDRSNSSNLFYGEYQFQKNFKPQQLVMTTGLVSTYSVSDSELYGDTIYNNNNYAAYLQLDKKIGDKLNLSAGARYEYNSTETPVLIQASDIFTDTIPEGKIEEGKPVFRFGANYKINEGTFLRTSWGQGYRYPTIAERFIQTNAGFLVLPNPKLTSETGWTAEIGIKQGVQISNWQGFMDIAAFWSEYQNMMEFQADIFIKENGSGIVAGFQSRNIGNTVIKGAEVSIGGQGNIGNIPTSITMGYTFLDPKYQDAYFTEEIKFQSSHCLDGGTLLDCDNVLKYRSRHSLKADIESKFNKLSIGVAGVYDSNIEAIDQAIAGLNGVGAYRAEHQDGNTRVDIRVGFNFTPKAKLSVLVNNLLNAELSDRPGTLAAPRNVSVRGEYQF